MTLRERTIIDRIEVLEDGSVQVRRATVIQRDGVEISRTFHRYVLSPGMDLTQEHPRVAAIARAAWEAGPAVMRAGD